MVKPPELAGGVVSRDGEHSEPLLRVAERVGVTDERAGEPAARAAKAREPVGVDFSPNAKGHESVREASAPRTWASSAG